MNRISIQEWFEQGSGELLDVRTPAEYGHGHIPGARNLPLFSDEERAVVGTLYKQVSQEKAFLKGLEFAGAKMSWYVKEAVKFSPGKKVAVHCWRGGQRSASIATLLDFAGFKVQVLDGGYKAYRNFVLDRFQTKKLHFVVLGGKTGSGKTEILRHMQDLGEQIIDLEALAHHKGSAFGALGEQPQPTVEQFENDLFREFFKLNGNRRVWVENESRSIGKVFIPQGFWEQIKSAPLVHLEVPFERRVKKLVAGYGQFPKEELETSLLKIERRMGGQNVKAALEAFRQGDTEEATAIALHYYDKTYLHATSQGNFSRLFKVDAKSCDCPTIARQLIDFANEQQL